MPNIDLLLDNIAQVVKSNNNHQTLFSALDLRYAYLQIPLDNSTREQCNFSLIDGNANGTYKFQTGFFFWPRGYTSLFSEGYRSDTYQLLEHVRISG